MAPLVEALSQVTATTYTRMIDGYVSNQSVEYMPVVRTFFSIPYSCRHSRSFSAMYLAVCALVSLGGTSVSPEYKPEVLRWYLLNEIEDDMLDLPGIVPVRGDSEEGDHIRRRPSI